MLNVLYIHGMGGGSDSRIPSILQECFTIPDASVCHSELSSCHSEPSSCHSERSEESIHITTRTYNFDPEVAALQIQEWVKEINPDLIIGESLGALHALRIKDIPIVLVSPALNAPCYFEALAWLTLIPGVTWIFDRIYKPREGDRQSLHFIFSTLRKYRRHRKAAMSNWLKTGSQSEIHAFFGTRDHYRRSGIVSLRTWKKYFGDTFTLYEGTHFMEEEFVRSILVDKIRSFFQDKL